MQNFKLLVFEDLSLSDYQSKRNHMKKLMALKSSAYALRLIVGILALSWQSLNATWQPAETISDPTVTVSDRHGPVLSVNVQGNALAVWRDNRGGTFTNTISSNFYNRGIGWQGARIISSLEEGPFNSPLYNAQADPSVAMNSSNYAVVVWEAEYAAGDFPQVIVSNVRQSNGLWGPVRNVSEDSSTIDGQNPSVALNESGTAVAAWMSESADSTISYVKVSILPFGGSWSTPLIISDPEAIVFLSTDTKPDVAINESGDIAVIWYRKYPGNIFGIDAATFDAGTATWSPPVHLQVSSIGDDLNTSPRIAIDENGNAVAIWSFRQGDVKTAFFTSGSGWGPSEVFSANVRRTTPMVVMDPAGNATAAWTSESDNFVDQIYSSFKPIGGAWTAPIVISTGTTNLLTADAYKPLAVDGEGNVMAVWDAGGRIVSAYRLFNQPWQAPETVFNEQTYADSVGLASCGFAVALWLNDPSEARAAVNENFFAPFGTGYTKCTERFAFQKVSLDILGWAPLPECILFYNIYCGDTLIGVVPGNGPYSFVNGSCNKCAYSLSSINIWGFESDRVPVLLQ